LENAKTDGNARFSFTGTVLAPAVTVGACTELWGFWP
jgi:hypothetical protein